MRRLFPKRSTQVENIDIVMSATYFQGVAKNYGMCGTCVSSVWCVYGAWCLGVWVCVCGVSGVVCVVCGVCVVWCVVCGVCVVCISHVVLVCACVCGVWCVWCVRLACGVCVRCLCVWCMCVCVCGVWYVCLVCVYVWCMVCILRVCICRERKGGEGGRDLLFATSAAGILNSIFLVIHLDYYTTGPQKLLFQNLVYIESNSEFCLILE